MRPDPFASVSKLHENLFYPDLSHCCKAQASFSLHKLIIVLVIVIIILFLLVAIYLLLVPIILYINTDTNQYYAQLKGLAKASIENDTEELIRLRLKVFFFNFNFYPLRKTTSKKKKPKSTQVKNKRKGISFKTGLRLFKSFKLKRFLLNVDTGNCITNAKLYPVFAFLNYRTGGFNINFQGRNQLVLHMQNRPIHIIRSFINF